MNVAHKALHNNWIYLIFFNVVSLLKVIANGVESVILLLFFFSQLFNFQGHVTIIHVCIVKILCKLLNYCGSTCVYINHLFITPLDYPWLLEINLG